MLHLLYHEAKKNVLSGRYPVPKELSFELAGIQAVIKQKESEDQALLTAADFKWEVFPLILASVNLHELPLMLAMMF